jgi:hypothetical protein
MYLKQAISLLVCLFFAYSVQAQSDVDALRLSLQYNTGNARNIGVGNTLGSVGGDISNIHTNPAGLGRISTTEFSLTPAVTIFNSESNYIGNNLEDTKLNFNLYNLGAVFGSKFKKQSEDNKFGKIRFGLSFNNIANLNQNFYMSGYNKHNSLIDRYYEQFSDFAETTNDLENMFPFGASLAYATDLIYFDTIDNRIYSSLNNGNVQQDIIIQRKGNLNEAAVAIASSFNNKINFGATLGMPILNFTETNKHKETDKLDSSYNFNFFEQTNTYRMSGFGVNLKLGILAQASKNLRISLAFHTPSIIFIDDAFSSKIDADYNNYTANATSPDGLVEYNLRLPWKLLTGVSYITKYGFVSAEYELSDAGAAKYKYKNANADIKEEEALLNKNINDKYKLYHTIKVGVEGKFDPIRVRAGFQYQTTPFDKNIVVDANSQRNLIYSAGLGFRKKHFYVDFAYQFVKGKESYTPYVLKYEDTSLQNTAENTFKRSIVALTVGYKF